MTIVTNIQYASTVKIFKTACKLAKVEPTARQASKFQNKRGKAYSFKDIAKRVAYK